MLETRGDVAEALSRRKGGNFLIGGNGIRIRSWYEVVDAEYILDAEFFFGCWLVVGGLFIR